MKTSTTRNKFLTLLVTVIFLIPVSQLRAQVIRPYSNVYSDNIRGGHSIIGNTITAIFSSGSGSTGTVNTASMNDFSTSGTGNYTYGRTSAYGNDNSNIQLVDVDGGGSTTQVMANGGMWRYYSLNNYNAVPPDIAGLNWMADNYNDASNWTNTANNSNAFGFNETGVNSPVQTNRETYYLRQDFNITNPAQYDSIALTASYDDGAIIYVNGTEVARMNMPAGAAPYGTNPLTNREFGDGDFILNIPVSAFLNGNNQVSVALYQGTSATVDFYFNMKLDAVKINETANSSSADLNMPAGTNQIKFARLYWGGRINGGMGGANNINLRTAKIKFNEDTYQLITAASGSVDKSLINGNDSAYQAYTDLTSFVNTHGNGTYTMADIKAATGSISGGGYYAGWALVVVYENQLLPYSSLRVYDGFLQVYDDGIVTSQTITLSGLNPPNNFAAPSDAYMSTVTWEGDANLGASAANPNGDFVRVNGIAVTNAVNPATNFWNGTISKNGVHVSGNKNPDFKNQMGIDIDEVEVGTGFGITPATSSISVQFGTEADQYFPSIFAFTMKTKPPLVQLDKSVKDTASGNGPWQLPNDLLNRNEIITYTITGKNLGIGNGLSCIVTDTIPAGLTYRPGSLKINVPTPGVTAGFKTDELGDDGAYKAVYQGKTYVKFMIGTGATAATGGMLMPNDSFNIQFQCIVPNSVTNLGIVSNTARITGTEQDGITPFVDDGTALIAPFIPGLAVSLVDFTVQRQNNAALLEWTTSYEFKNDHFDIENSIDAVNFNKIASIKGNGTGTNTTKYQYRDPLTLTAGIIYYRLKMVDMDNNTTYSKIVALRQNGLAVLKDFQVYPNPFSGNLKFQISSLKETAITIRINNAHGQQEKNYKVMLQPGANIVVLSNLETCKPGTYLMEIISEEGHFIQKIIKQ